MSDHLELPTCGKGLAESATLPARLGELSAAMSAVLEEHMQALDLSDANSKQEYEAYQKVAGGLEESAARLTATAQEMVRCRDLPMGRHDEQAMTQPRMMEVFEDYVRRKQALLTYLQKTLEQDQEMLVEMSRVITRRK